MKGGQATQPPLQGAAALGRAPKRFVVSIGLVISPGVAGDTMQPARVVSSCGFKGVKPFDIVRAQIALECVDLCV